MPGRERPDSKIPTKNPQAVPAGSGRGRRRAVGPGRGQPGGKVVSGVTRAGREGRRVIETPEGITDQQLTLSHGGRSGENALRAA